MGKGQETRTNKNTNCSLQGTLMFQGQLRGRDVSILFPPPAKLTSVTEALNSPLKVRVSVRGKIVQVRTN